MSSPVDLGAAAVEGFLDRWQDSVPSPSDLWAIAVSILQIEGSAITGRAAGERTLGWIEARLADPAAPPPWDVQVEPGPPGLVDWADIERGHVPVLPWVVDSPVHLNLNPEDTESLAGAVLYAARNAADVTEARQLGWRGADEQIVAIRQMHEKWAKEIAERESD